jgi:RNA polymerase sigma factor (sigma-70 family)
MAGSHLNSFIRHLRGVLATRESAGLTEAELWKRYVHEHDEAAFATLLHRHGPMVLRVCRGILRNEHDAEDAFQATFLILVRRATSLRSPDTIANWLYGVARRTALEAKGAAAQRRKKEAAILPKMATPEVVYDDLRSALGQELEQLAQKYRSAVILCDLEGRTRQEVARQLGWPEGTVASRLARGRSMLAKRLARRGFTGAFVAGVLGDGTASACLPTGLVTSTIRAACLSTTKEATARAFFSAKAIALAEGVLKSMLLTKVKIVVSALLVLGIVCLGAGGMISRTLATEVAGEEPSLQEQSQSNPGDQHERLMELKRQLREIQYDIARLEQETQVRRNELKPDVSFLANRFRYRVPFETGRTQTNEGGRIEIREVWALVRKLRSAANTWCEADTCCRRACEACCISMHRRAAPGERLQRRSTCNPQQWTSRKANLPSFTGCQGPGTFI